MTFSQTSGAYSVFAPDGVQLSGLQDTVRRTQGPHRTSSLNASNCVSGPLRFAVRARS